MTGHEFGNLFPVALVVIFIIGAVRRQLSRVNVRAAAEAAAARGPVGPKRPQPAPVRRRLAPGPAAPALPPVLPASARVSAPAALAPYQTLPIEAAGAFPTLDMSLGDAPVFGAVAAPRRARRGIAGGAPLGSPGWSANAVLALEILGPPVSLRSGATLGAPHAF